MAWNENALQAGTGQMLSKQQASQQLTPNYGTADMAPTGPPGVSSSLSQTMNLVDGVLERVSQIRGSLMQEPQAQNGGKEMPRSGMAGLLEAINDKLRTTHLHLDSLERYLNS